MALSGYITSMCEHSLGMFCIVLGFFFKCSTLALFLTGTTDVGPLGKQRVFLSYPHCRKSLGVQSGKTYLIMGAAKDIHRDDQAQTWVCSSTYVWVVCGALHYFSQVPFRPNRVIRYNADLATHFKQGSLLFRLWLCEPELLKPFKQWERWNLTLNLHQMHVRSGTAALHTFSVRLFTLYAFWVRRGARLLESWEPVRSCGN